MTCPLSAVEENSVSVSHRGFDTAHAIDEYKCFGAWTKDLKYPKILAVRTVAHRVRLSILLGTLELAFLSSMLCARSVANLKLGRSGIVP